MGLIIGLAGRKNSGKSTAAKMICEMVPRAVEIAFADPMKEFVAKIFDWPIEMLNGPSEGKERPDLRYPRPPDGQYKNGGPFLTPRYALQQIGTDWGRHCYPNIWVDYAIRRAHQLLAEESFPGPGGAPSSLVVISDTRFVNESRAIQAAGGAVIRLRRHDALLDTHASETEIDGIEADHDIWNSTSLVHLQLKLTNALHELGVLRDPDA